MRAKMYIAKSILVDIINFFHSMEHELFKFTLNKFVAKMRASEELTTLITMQIPALHTQSC